VRQLGVGRRMFALLLSCRIGGTDVQQTLQANVELNSPRRDRSPKPLLAERPDDAVLLGAAELVLSSIYQAGA